MNENIYLRPLRYSDASISYKWRNDSEVWSYTGNRPTKLITLEIEQDWISNVLKRKNEARYAICTIENDKYIGNAQLIGIENETAEFHIFIGDKNYWGKGIGKEVTKKMILIGFRDLNLKSIYSDVDMENIPSIHLLISAGFFEENRKGNKICMRISKIR